MKQRYKEYAIEYRIHATRRMFQRSISQESVEEVLSSGDIIENYDSDFPLPSVLVSGRTHNNRPLHVVVGINIAERKLVVITAYEPDPKRWSPDYSKRCLS